jgi:mannose-6-phosphate isomerase-like protein (cupin superfamily)
MLEYINHKDELLAIIVREKFHDAGIRFFTPNNFSQQLGYMNHPAGYRIEPHIHNPIRREVFYTQEVLFIKDGKVKVDFYDPQKKYLESRLLYRGDTLLLASGGHGFEMMEPTVMIEIKQGPYAGESDKTRFSAVNFDPT